MEDLIFSGSVRSVVNACVHRCVNDNQLQTAGLLQECIMIRDSLTHLPDAFTVDDTSDIVRYLCTFQLFCPLCLSCTFCTILYNNNNNNNNGKTMFMVLSS